jgi:uncharacterized surface protein with fasciclin (FAS1) repeats
MKQVIKHTVKSSMLLLGSALILFSCNKVYDPIPGTTAPVRNPATTLAKQIAANTSYSILNTALTRTGLNVVLDNPNSNFTVFAPSNTAFAASGIDLAAVNAMPVAQLSAVLLYHVIPNEVIASSSISTSFPNMLRASALTIGTNNLVTGLNSTAIPFKNSIFPSSRTAGAWVNNIPVIAPDAIVGSNGVAHGVAAVVAPPSQLLVQALAADPDFTYLMAAAARADSGQAVTNNPATDTRIQFALSFPLASLTVFAPTNQAFQNLLIPAITQALVRQGLDLATAQTQATALASSPAVFSNAALFPVLTAQFVRGILAYHVLGQRAFAANFPTTAASFPTLLNGVITNHPGVAVNASFTGPIATGLSVKGVGNATAATSAPLPTGFVDRTAVNGVFYKINQVLLPQ